MIAPDQEFDFGWPEGVKIGDSHSFSCSEISPDEGISNLTVHIIDNGDICVEGYSRQEVTELTDMTRVWCRHGIGGGAYPNTYQALLQLAKAIKLDNERLQRK